MRRHLQLLAKYWHILYFSIALMMLVFAAGIAVGRYQLFPYDLVRSAWVALSDWKNNWRHNLGIRPDKLIQPARLDGTGVIIHQQGKPQDGVTFITGFWKDTYGMKLVTLDGATIHEWRVSFDRIWPERPSGAETLQDWDAQIHGAVLYPNGDVVINFRSHGTVRMDRCAQVVWRLPRHTHHSVHVDYEGNLWIPGANSIEGETDQFPFISPPLQEDLILKVSPDGKVLQELSVLDVLYASDYEGSLFANGLDSPRYTNVRDITHLNDIEVLSPEMAANFPLFEPGDIMISLRNLNLVAVIDRQTAKIKWSMTGPFLRQHDPDFLADGRIAVFDNRRDESEGRVFGGSRILDIDPLSGQVGVYYASAPGGEFFANIMGEHQRLANGNGLVVESERGRVFEVTPDGEVVWTYINRWNEEEVATIYHATRYPANYADFAQQECS
jgi:Arylsulfotransferase (ASST)